MTKVRDLIDLETKARLLAWSRERQAQARAAAKRIHAAASK